MKSPWPIFTCRAGRVSDPRSLSGFSAQPDFCDSEVVLPSSGAPGHMLLFNWCHYLNSSKLNQIKNSILQSPPTFFKCSLINHMWPVAPMLLEHVLQCGMFSRALFYLSDNLMRLLDDTGFLFKRPPFASFLPKEWFCRAKSLVRLCVVEVFDMVNLLNGKWLDSFTNQPTSVN